MRSKKTPNPSKQGEPNKSKGSLKGSPSKKRKMAKATIRVTQGRRSFKISRKMLKEIKRLQSSVAMCIPKLPFVRVIKEVLHEMTQSGRNLEGMRIQKEMVEALQEAAETYMTNLFEDTNVCAAHANRITVKPLDLKLALRLRGGLMSDAQ